LLSIVLRIALFQQGWIWQKVPAPIAHTTHIHWRFPCGCLRGADSRSRCAKARCVARYAAVAEDLATPVAFVTAENARFTKIREIYNGAILTKPKLIACCSSEAGVQQAVRHAVDEKLNVAVKSGGHCFEGFA
jgi:hypothetical protein